MRYHICWGSWNGPHISDVPLKDIVDLVLQVQRRRLLHRGGQPAPRARVAGVGDVKLPEGKMLIPGVISHATNIVEHPELVAQRIVRFAEARRPRERDRRHRLRLRPGPVLRRVHPSIMWAKLGALAEGAALASRELWG